MMVAYPLKLPVLSVQVKTFIGHKLDGTDAEAGCIGIRQPDTMPEIQATIRTDSLQGNFV